MVRSKGREREDAENWGRRGSAGEVQGEKLRGRETAEEGRERERKTETGRGMIAHAAQMCLKHRAALAMPSPNLYPLPPHPFRDPTSRLFDLASSRSVSRPPPLRLVIRANLIARRHRWPLTGIELSAVSVPGTWTAGLPRAYCAKEVTMTLWSSKLSSKYRRVRRALRRVFPVSFRAASALYPLLFSCFAAPTYISFTLSIGELEESSLGR